ncbi:MAG: hypothetical protein QOJ84_3484 [Bradyrhizobium sp.]|jgi:hypothetical protein|nr:hypothetical protein [Bradyrhizobium sp.]
MAGRPMFLLEIWDELKAPDGFTFDWMTHALRSYTKGVLGTI